VIFFIFILFFGGWGGVELPQMFIFDRPSSWVELLLGLPLFFYENIPFVNGD
jgi:hypothetical protein